MTKKGEKWGVSGLKAKASRKNLLPWNLNLLPWNFYELPWSFSSDHSRLKK